MPLYEYKCDSCGAKFEALQRFSDPPFAVHDQCGGAVHRLVSVSALQFKGTGWYVTDYAKQSNGKDKSDQPAKKESTESAKPAEPAKSDSAKSDSAKSDSTTSKSS